ncbi:hypothetical protein K7X08_032378 [Anisodus acutangulus]|uniref:Uncharacterized protein n=1 Tax=Anisodus acutangulus TaxID=402998 RepID=A0A9Q1LWW8_9SOLA|nr:hypothetical protein K7X08_032378 [Anisodus acutangulus]
MHNRPSFSPGDSPNTDGIRIGFSTRRRLYSYYRWQPKHQHFRGHLRPWPWNKHRKLREYTESSCQKLHSHRYSK